jgi:hypothetical protein
MRTAGAAIASAVVAEDGMFRVAGIGVVDMAGLEEVTMQADLVAVRGLGFDPVVAVLGPAFDLAVAVLGPVAALDLAAVPDLVAELDLAAVVAVGPVAAAVDLAADIASRLLLR